MNENARIDEADREIRLSAAPDSDIEGTTREELDEKREMACETMAEEAVESEKGEWNVVMNTALCILHTSIVIRGELPQDSVRLLSIRPLPGINSSGFDDPVSPAFGAFSLSFGAWL